MSGDALGGAGLLLAMVVAFFLKRLPADIVYNKIIPIATTVIGLVTSIVQQVGAQTGTVTPASYTATAAIAAMFGPIWGALQAAPDSAVYAGVYVPVGFFDGLLRSGAGAVLGIGINALGLSVGATGIHSWGKNFWQGIKTGFTPPALAK